jgi:hypothetical protein
MRQDLERSSQPVLPFQFWAQLRESYPQFGQQNNAGAYMQQDAEECWTQLLYSLRERLKAWRTSSPKKKSCRAHGMRSCLQAGTPSNAPCPAQGIMCAWLQAGSSLFQMQSTHRGWQPADGGTLHAG